MAASMMNESADQKAWRAREALSTIHRAAEHQKDASLMREVKKLAAEQLRATESVKMRDNGGPGSERKRMAEKPEAPKLKGGPVKMANDKDRGPMPKTAKGGGKSGYLGIKGLK